MRPPQMSTRTSSSHFQRCRFHTVWPSRTGMKLLHKKKAMIKIKLTDWRIVKTPHESCLNQSGRSPSRKRSSSSSSLPSSPNFICSDLGIFLDFRLSPKAASAGSINLDLIFTRRRVDKRRNNELDVQRRTSPSPSYLRLVGTQAPPRR
ncbi:hypothetical protein IHE45_05G095300 [Dioscorea alata]|uniref:Uncharacterized protein n=1 Tax=Dioscorea alata TaxID=55571 RepID=A0ACB7W3S4_DIOAL|nr:hypothetical protein IHE45_05G095300 [Dioscorea alata]